MNAKSIKNKKIVQIDNSLEIVFFTSKSNFPDTNLQALNYDDFSLSFNLNDDIFDINIYNNTISSNSFSIKINYDIILDFNENHIDFSYQNFNYRLSTEDALFLIDNEGIITVRFSTGTSLISLTYLNNGEILPQSFQANITFIDENSSMPEFSIGSFDDSAFTIARPIRQGIPIISSVPSTVNSNSSSADINYYNQGLGGNYKTIYFRIICNKVMENISPNDTSEMKLKIYMPNGLDTVKKAIYEPMTLVSTDSTNNISIYRSSHDFYIQGTYDGIEYVDGYMYCDVHVPLTVQKSIPVEIDFVF